MTAYTTAETISGTVRGSTSDGIATYLAVPCAAPPAGPLRFAAPHPAPAWTGVRDALAAGPSAPQNAATSFFGLDMVAVTGAEWRRGDDYLALNIWAPASAENRPVMVYIHGGGLVLGTKDAAAYDGRNFARDGVVAVNLNYRLGVEGFLAIPGAPTNLGLRDMLAGFAWVRDNIRSFGGDPDDVTAFGESGGGVAVACLVSSPLSKGLLRRAIVQSGHGSAVYPLDIAHRHQQRSSGGQTLARILTDLSFRWPARQFAEAHHGRTFAFEFDWHSPASGGRLGAAHGMDLAFVFDTLPSVTGRHGIAGENPPQPPRRRHPPHLARVRHHRNGTLA